MTKREEWQWIQQHEPKLAELLLAMKSAGIPANGIIWRKGGPQA